MPYYFENREAASKAGKISRRGKSQKTKQWEKLGEALLSGHAEKLNRELSKLDGIHFVNAYISILKFFKPRLQSIEVEPVQQPEPPPLPYNIGELSKMTNEQLINEIKLLENGSIDKAGNATE